MRIRVLGGSGGMCPGRMLTSFRIDEEVLLDAGSTAQTLTLKEQAEIRHVLLTHAHLDHCGTLPFLAENTLGFREDACVVHSNPESIRSLRDHLFNGVVWPDFSRIPDVDRAPIRFLEIPEGEPTRVGSLTVTAVRVHHTVPAVGYVLDDGRSAVVFSGDTGSTQRLWEEASRNPRLRAAFIETSFPDRLQEMAKISGHLTPQTLVTELSKLRPRVPTFVYHVKPRFHDEVAEEVARLGRGELSIVEQGRDYDF